MTWVNLLSHKDLLTEAEILGPQFHAIGLENMSLSLIHNHCCVFSGESNLSSTFSNPQPLQMP